MRSRIDRVAARLAKAKAKVTVILFQHVNPGEPERHYTYTAADLEEIRQAERLAAQTGQPQLVVLHDYGPKISTAIFI